MRQSIAALVLVFVSLLAGCDRGPASLTLALPGSPLDREAAQGLVETFARASAMTLDMTEVAMSDEAAMDALMSGDIDIALVSNSMPYRDGLSAILPVYPTVLHIGYTGSEEGADPSILLRNARVFAGAEGSASRFLFERLIDHRNLGHLQFEFIDPATASIPPDVFVVFSPISPDSLRARITEIPRFRLISMGDPDDVGKGSAVDAAALTSPFFRPFVIPAGIYGDWTPQPVLTLAVDTYLLARPGLDKSVVYDLINELLRLRPALVARNPAIFRDLSSDFDAELSTFVLHPGAQAFLQRSAPSVYERYSGIAEVVVTVMVALASAIVAGVRIYRLRRKNRIDAFYVEVIRLRSSVARNPGRDESEAIIEKLRDLQEAAFELLVDEKIAADESFRIFITLSNDVIAELRNSA